MGPPAQPKPALSVLRNRASGGAEDKNLQTQSVDLTTARSQDNPYRLGLTGNVLAVVNSTYVTDLIYVRFGDRGPFVPLGPRLAALAGQPFQYLWAYWTAQAGSTITLLSATENTITGDVVRPIYR